MLKLALTTLPLFQAGFDEITKMAVQSGAADFLPRSRPLNGTRSAPLTTSMSNVWEYGCWCYFQDDHGRGRGQPQNEMDSICQVLHHGYTCIIMDAITEGIDCDPFTHGYTTIQVLGNSNQELEVDFTTANNGDVCATRTCLVEAQFILNFIHIGTTPGFVFDPTLKHDLGIFDPNTCKSGQGRGWIEEECCGVYPIRYPYKTQGGDRKCCVDRTYDSTLKSCCADGSVSLSC